MGAFYISFEGCSQTLVLPNRIHDEGLKWLLDRMLGAGTTRTFRMGLTSRGLTAPLVGRGTTPNDPTSGIGLDVSMKYPDFNPAIDPPPSNSQGGAYVNEGFAPGAKDLHRKHMNKDGGMEEHSVLFDVVKDNPTDFHVVSRPVEFSNAIPWVKTRDSYFSGWTTINGTSQPRQPLLPWHQPWRSDMPEPGYPWHWPQVDSIAGPENWTSGGGGGPNFPDQFDNGWRFDASDFEPFAVSSAANLHRVSSLPMGSIYIVTNADELLVSARFSASLLIRPGGTITAYWKGKIEAQ